jgi:rubrerythrin
MSTDKNLQEAFAGESQANRKYLAFAKKADQDGFRQVAKLFRAAAAAETVHAHSHLRVMKGVKSTSENLAAAIEGEAHEFQSMYPEFLREAETQGNVAAETTFRYALAVEEIHHMLFTSALGAVKEGKDLTAEPIYVCEVCGHTITGAPPDRCPICKAAKERFIEVS